MPNEAKKYVLPQLVITRLTDESDSESIKVLIKSNINISIDSYHVRPKLSLHNNSIRKNIENHNKLHFEIYPLVLDKNHAPWPEANLWILSCLQDKALPNMTSFHSIAADLAAFLRFIEDQNLDWTNFPEEKLKRPTYRYNAHLKISIQTQEIASSTAKRRMGTIIRFYKWLKSEKLFVPANPTWKETDVYVEITNYYGDSLLKKVTTTDVSIKTPQQEDPFDECIQDGGKLRPLTQTEQTWLIDALVSLENTEMLLIHLFGLVTGARIQTILTFRVKDVQKEYEINQHSFIRYPVGPGTGIDTKFGKRQVLHIPIWFYEKLRTYAHSHRAKSRRLSAKGGDVQEQYLFLSEKGMPFYQAKTQLPDEGNNTLRHKKMGQGVRQYIFEYVLPFIKQKYDVKFHYRPHDLRATYGMNLVDDRMKLVDQGKISLKEVLDFVKVRMGHTSFKTTENYLNYRSRLHIVRQVQDGWEMSLTKLVKEAMGDSNEQL